MERKLTEERLYERLSIPIKISYEVLNRPRDIKASMSKNISGGGICLSLPEKLLPDARINMKLTILQPKTENYNLKGRIVWARCIEVSGKSTPSVYYDTGIEFQDADPIVIGKIITYFYNRKI